MDSDSGLLRDQGADLPDILTALLSSRVRYKLLALFAAGQDEPRHARQLAKDTGEHFNSVWQELKHLESLGLLTSEKVGSQVRYRTEPSFPLLPELRQLMRRAEGQLAGEQADGGQPAAGPRAKPQTMGIPSQPPIPTSPRPAARVGASFVIGEVD